MVKSTTSGKRKAAGPAVNKTPAPPSADLEPLDDGHEDGPMGFGLEDPLAGRVSSEFASADALPGAPLFGDRARGAMGASTIVSTTLPDDRNHYSLVEAIDITFAAKHGGTKRTGIAAKIKTERAHAQVLANAIRFAQIRVFDQHTMMPIPLRAGVEADFIRIDFASSLIATDDLILLARDQLGVELKVPAQEPAVVVADQAKMTAMQSAVPSRANAESAEQRRNRLQARKAELKAQGIHDYSARVATEEGITTTRLRQLLGDEGMTREVTASNPFGLARKPIGQGRKR